MTPFAYSKIPKGLLPLTHQAINYVFVSKNRSTAKNSTGTIWENLKFLIWEISNLKSNTEQTKNATPGLPGHIAKVRVNVTSPKGHSHPSELHTPTTIPSFIVTHTHLLPTGLLLI